MAHKTKVGGTYYSIKGGKCRVSGTNYSIKKGRTRVNGTNYDISFGPATIAFRVQCTSFDAYGDESTFYVSGSAKEGETFADILEYHVGGEGLWYDFNGVFCYESGDPYSFKHYLLNDDYSYVSVDDVIIADHTYITQRTKV